MLKEFPASPDRPAGFPLNFDLAGSRDSLRAPALAGIQ